MAGLDFEGISHTIHVWYIYLHLNWFLWFIYLYIYLIFMVYLPRFSWFLYVSMVFKKYLPTLGYIIHIQIFYLKKRTGHGLLRMTFTFSNHGTSSCAIEACSESQARSRYDGRKVRWATKKTRRIHVLYIYLPGSSRYVKHLPFGRVFLLVKRCTLYTPFRKIQVFTYVYLVNFLW